jgi:hypothetical protein
MLLRFGELIQSGSGTIIDYLVGTAIHGIGVARCETLMQEDLSSAQLSELVRLLAPSVSSRVGLRRALKGEYRFGIMATKAIDSGDESIENCLFMEWSRLLSWLQRPLIQPNRTARLYANSYRRMIANVGRPYKDMDRRDFGDEEFSMLRLAWRLLLPNPVGKILHQLLIPAMQGVLEKKCEQETAQSCLRLVAACLAYEQDKGQLPDELAELMPAYIESIPRDPWDGEQMRYSKEKAIIYAVGSDLVDSGGSTEATEAKHATRAVTMRKYAEDMVYAIHPEQAE